MFVFAGYSLLFFKIWNQFIQVNTLVNSIIIAFVESFSFFSLKSIRQAPYMMVYQVCLLDFISFRRLTKVTAKIPVRSLSNRWDLTGLWWRLKLKKITSVFRATGIFSAVMSETSNPDVDCLWRRNMTECLDFGLNWIEEQPPHSPPSP